MTTTASLTDDVKHRITGLDPAFAQLAGATAGQAWALDHLTDREKVFLSLTADTCHQWLGLPFELHVRSGVALGIGTAEMRRVLRLVSYDTGYAAALGALERLDAIETALGDGTAAGDRAPDLLEPASLATGPDAPASPLPPPVVDRLRALDPQFLDYFHLQSRMRASAHFADLSERERGVLAMSIDVHYRTLGDTFAIHVDRAVRAGAGAEEVRAVVRFLAQFGATRAWEAWLVLNTLLPRETAAAAAAAAG